MPTNLAPASLPTAPLEQSASPAIDEEKLFTFYIERGDLGMPPGKLASQAIHASRLSLLRYLRFLPASDMAAAMDMFIELNSCGSAIALRAKNLAQIERARDEAIQHGLPWAMFSDSGHVLLPSFTGAPTISGLAIGPAPRSAIHPITKRFRCTP